MGEKTHHPECAYLAGYGCTCAEIEYLVYAQAEGARVAKLAEAWKLRWPNHCRKCLGHGGHDESQSHPYGSTSAREYWFEPCECIVGDSACPRCGHQHLNEWEGETCTVCKWSTNQSGTPAERESVEAMACPMFEC